MPRLFYGITPPPEYEKVFTLKDKNETWFVYMTTNGDWENYRIVKQKKPDDFKANYYIGYLPSERRFAKGREYHTIKLKKPEMFKMFEKQIKAIP